MKKEEKLKILEELAKSKGLSITQLIDKVNEILENKELTNEFHEYIVTTLFSSEEITDMLLTFALIKLQDNKGETKWQF